MKKMLLLLLIPFSFIPKQEDCWEIKLHKQKIGCGAFDEPFNVEVDNTATGTLKIIAPKNKITKDWNHSIIIMNEARNTLYSSAFKEGSNIVSIDIKELKEKSKGETFNIYKTGLPKDKELAATIRIRPILVCTVRWK